MTPPKIHLTSWNRIFSSFLAFAIVVAVASGCGTLERLGSRAVDGAAEAARESEVHVYQDGSGSVELENGSTIAWR